MTQHTHIAPYRLRATASAHTPILAGVLVALWGGVVLGQAAHAQPAQPATAHVQALAEQALAERFPGDAGRLAVRVKRVEAALGEAATLRLDMPTGDGLPRGTTQVKLLAGSDAAGWERVGWALLYVSLYDSVLVARAPLRPGDAVTPDALRPAWIETTRFAGEPLRPAALRRLLADGAVFAARTIGADKVLRRDQVRPAYAAETGATVMMRFERGGLRLNLTCKARETGHTGDAIRLYSSDTGKTYRARLTGPGTAAWIETL